MEENKKEEVVNNENTESKNNLSKDKKIVLLVVGVILIILILILGLYFLKESIEKDKNDAKIENDNTTVIDSTKEDSNNTQNNFIETDNNDVQNEEETDNTMVIDPDSVSFEPESDDTTVTESEVDKSLYRLNSNNFEEFDIGLLRFKNEKKNIIYSPLSIKYALSMLNEGTSGKSNEEIKALIGDYTGKKYTNSSNMSVANALFVRDTFKNKINMDYIERINNKYGAEVIYDTFENADNLNKWISDKSFGLINKAKDKIDNNTLFSLVNSLAIDMDWDFSFREMTPAASYDNTNYWWTTNTYAYVLVAGVFNESDEKITTMEIKASLSNYDVVKAHGGEESFRNELTNYYEQCYKEEGLSATNEEIQDKVNLVYKNLSSVYGRVDKSTEYQFYTDDDVKVFAKDLKTYDGITLQYVAFMPINVDLETFIQNIRVSKLTEYINSLITLDRKNFKDGVITEIGGTIPKFKYEYKFNLIKDLKLLGINEIFDQDKANFSEITSENTFVGEMLHDISIDFNEVGIKANATAYGAEGGTFIGGQCDYIERNLPVEKIDITFDKPYLYIVRDKNTGEVWFIGKVYNPVLCKEKLVGYCQ